MKVKVVVFVVMLIFISACSDVGNEEQHERTITNEQWIEDVDFVVNSILEIHPSPFHFTDEEQWRDAVEQLKQDIPNLSEDSINFRIMQLVAQLNDAHTAYAFNKSEIFPLLTRYFGDEIRVMTTLAENNSLLGMELVEINNIPIASVVEKVDTVISHENDQWAKVQRGKKIINADISKFLDISNGDTATFTLVDNAGEQVKVELEAMGGEEFLNQQVTLEPSNKPLRAQAPQNADPNFWYTYLPDEQMIYFNYIGSVGTDYEPLEALTEELLTLISEQDGEVKKIVFDLRQNVGGSNAGFNELVYELKVYQAVFDFEVNALIGPTTFSSGTSAAMDVKNHLNATLIGEETGGNAKAFGNGQILTLPNSKGSLMVSAKYFNLGDYENGILPDIEVIENFEDYWTGIDKAFEETLK